MTAAVEQLTSTEGLSAEEIVDAVAEGRLNEYLRANSKKLRAEARAAEAADKPVVEAAPESVGDVDQGARGTRPASPTEGKSAGEIVEMLARGELDTYMQTPNRVSRSRLASS